MKKRLFAVCIAVSSLLASLNMSAAEPVKIADSVNQITLEFENVEGVECTSIKKGEGLGLIKAMFSKYFGRKFLKGVTSMVIIDYTNASEEVCASLRNRVETFSEVLDEFDLGEGELEEGEYVKSYATVNGTTSISDFMAIIEDKESKMFMYMSGELVIKGLKFEF